MHKEASVQSEYAILFFLPIFFLNPIFPVCAPLLLPAHIIYYLYHLSEITFEFLDLHLSTDLKEQRLRTSVLNGGNDLILLQSVPLRMEPMALGPLESTQMLDFFPHLL